MKIVALSDTHGYHPDIPDGDVLIHAGDLCGRGTESEFSREMAWLGSLPHAVKLYVPGNHERWVEPNQVEAREIAADQNVRLLIMKWDVGFGPQTIMANVSVLDGAYRPASDPFVFNISGG